MKPKETREYLESNGIITIVSTPKPHTIYALPKHTYYTVDNRELHYSTVVRYINSGKLWPIDNSTYCSV